MKIKEKIKSLRIVEMISILLMILIIIVYVTCSMNFVQICSIIFLAILILFLFLEIINKKTPTGIKSKNFFIIILSVVYIASIIYIRQR